MSDAFRKIRMKFMYVFLASTLLSGAVLYVCYRIVTYLYAKGLEQGNGFSRLLTWMINHVGTIPMLLAISLALFANLFYYRSSKIEADILRLVARMDQSERDSLMEQGLDDETAMPATSAIVPNTPAYIRGRKKRQQKPAIRLTHVSGSFRGRMSSGWQGKRQH